MKPSPESRPWVGRVLLKTRPAEKPLPRHYRPWARFAVGMFLGAGAGGGVSSVVLAHQDLVWCLLVFGVTGGLAGLAIPGKWLWGIVYFLSIWP